MSERYTKVFSLPENLYATGAPVAVSAGALLKDNQTGKVLAQLKLTNIQYKKIKAVKVKLFPQDTMGQPLGDAVEYQYLDLQITRDADFGSKTPILFPDATTRSFAVEVTTVVFADNTAWNSDGTFWEPIPDRVALHQKYDNLVIEQLRLEQSGTCQFVVQEYKDLWLCTCGAVNHDGEVRCHDCGKQLSQIHPLDAARLMERANARLAEEARLAAEEEATKAAAAVAAKKKTAKILKIVIPAVCAIIAVTLLTTKVIIPNSKYNKAVSLMEAGQYEDAIAAFEAMDGYKDSAEQIAKCEDAKANTERERQYTEAVSMMDKGKYEEALIIFTQLDGYRDSTEHIKIIENEFTYQKAISLLNANAYSKDYLAHQKAYDLFAEIKGYKDVADYLNDFEKRCVHIEYLTRNNNSVASETFFYYDQTGAVDYYGYENFETDEKGTYQYIPEQYGNWYLNKLYYNGKSECKKYIITYKEQQDLSNTEIHSVTFPFEDEKKMSVSFENDVLTITRTESTWTDVMRLYDDGNVEEKIHYSSTNLDTEIASTVTFNHFGRREKIEHTEIKEYGNGEVVTDKYVYHYEYNDKMHCILLKSSSTSSSKLKKDTTKDYTISIRYDKDGNMTSYTNAGSEPRRIEYAMVYCPGMN